MLPWFNQIVQDGITPNGLYLLMSVVEGKSMELIDYPKEKALLEKAECIKDNKITDKGKSLIGKYQELYRVDERGKRKKKSLHPHEEEFVHQYRDLFPKGTLPSGYPARVPYKELEKRFLWFFENYSYSWDVVLKATKFYIEKYRQENFKYMKTSGYFISKMENGTNVSALATYCDLVGDITEQASSSDEGGYSSAL